MRFKKYNELNTKQRLLLWENDLIEKKIASTEEIKNARKSNHYFKNGHIITYFVGDQNQANLLINNGFLKIENDIVEECEVTCFVIKSESQGVSNAN